MKHPSSISVHDYTYTLPPEKIATYPLKRRDESRLLIFRDQTIEESRFKHLGDFLPAASTLVFNTTRVINARLRFTNTSGKIIEVFCLEPAEAGVDPTPAMAAASPVNWICLVGNLKSWKQNELELSNGSVHLRATVERTAGLGHMVHFSWNPPQLSFAEVLDALGEVPIPPYLKRESETLDRERYQTLYAKNQGSVAAPTAGLHFTDRVFQDLRARGMDTAGVTLHVSAGTFMPVKADTMKDHNMHAEWIDVTQATLRELLQKPAEKTIAVGTTALRTLETLYWMGVKAAAHPEATLSQLEIGQWDAYDLDPIARSESLQALLRWMQNSGLNRLVCRTQILIAPPYDLKMAAGIITNFHQPQSTLLLLISAIVGDRWKDIYSYALLHDFRFLSYGDSSLLLK